MNHLLNILVKFHNGATYSELVSKLPEVRRTRELSKLLIEGQDKGYILRPPKSDLFRITIKGRRKRFG